MEDWSIEVSPSGRAKCRCCNEFILKGVARLANTDGYGFFHVACWKIDYMPADFKDINSLGGFANLPADIQKEVRDAALQTDDDTKVKNNSDSKKRVPQASSSSKKAVPLRSAKKMKSAKQLDDNDENDENDDEDVQSEPEDSGDDFVPDNNKDDNASSSGRRITRSTTARITSASFLISTYSASTHQRSARAPIARKIRIYNKYTEKDFTDDSSESEEEDKNKKSRKRKTPAKNSKRRTTREKKSVSSVQDDKEEKEYTNKVREKAAELESLTTTKLKEMLKHNDMVTSGNKGDLLQRVADAMLFGALPRCPKCGSGRLRYEPVRGVRVFKCPGYMDDDTFVRCSFSSNPKSSTDPEVKRNAWKQL